MFEMTGGGAGVLDYDRDGWPDLFLAQGSDWPLGSDSLHTDRLKRNLGGIMPKGPVFEDVTQVAGVHENSLGQGVATVDVDSDGFDDIYVCNFGVNQLWLNRGDGTFRDGSSFIEPLPPQWTVSAAIADLNNDGLADSQFDANRKTRCEFPTWGSIRRSCVAQWIGLRWRRQSTSVHGSCCRRYQP